MTTKMFAKKMAEAQPAPQGPSVQVVLEEIYDPQGEKCEGCGEQGRVVESTTDGDFVCLRCGQVVGDRVVSEGSEWRTFGDSEGRAKDDPQRTGGPENSLLADMGLSTIIGKNAKDPLNNTLSKFQSRDSLDNHHRTLLEAFHKISVMAGRLSLPHSVIQRAQEFYKRIVDSKELKNRKSEALQAVCLYMALKLANVPRTIKELCTATGVRKRDVSRLYTKIKKLKLYRRKGGSTTSAAKDTAAPQTVVFMERYCSQLQLPRTTTNAATTIVKKVSELGLLEGKQPQTIAGSAIFMVCQLAPAYKKTFQEISEVTSMAAGTLRQAFHMLHARRFDLVPENFVPKAVVEQLQANPVGA